MEFKKIHKCLAVATLFAQFAVLPETSYADTGKNNKQKTESNSVENTGKGLLGYYFKDSQFSDLIMIQANTTGRLHVNSQTQNGISTEEKQNIHSARWMGYIKPSETGEYKISTSSDKNVIIQLDGNPIIKQSAMEKYIQLEKNKLYEIKIEYRGESNPFGDLELFWSTADTKMERIPDENLFTPNLTEKTEMPDEKNEHALIPNVNLFGGQKQLTRNKRSVNTTLQDIDKDGIPDNWENDGYTIRNGVVTSWDDTYSSQGYKKYVSNPYNARTAADPYTDFQKVTGYMPAATKAEARDPLVAAYPAVGVGMEKLIFSKNENVTEGSTNTKSTSITKTNGTTKSVEVGASIGISDKKFSINVSSKYSQSWNSSTAVQDTKGETWSKQIGINTDQAAFLNANVRYYNAGTAPIYEVRPTTNFVLRNANQSLTTIKAGPNQIGNSLAPGDTYPKKGQSPISLDKANEAGTMKISLNASQLDSIQSQGETIDLETTQSSGQYGILDPSNGNLVTDAGKQWDHIRSNIDKTSGSLILETGRETLERRVAAKDANNPEDKTPEITVGEAIKRAFGAVEKNGQLYYTEQETGREIPIHESAINIVVDKSTEDELNKQLEQTQKNSVYDVTFKRGMNITLHTPNMYDDFESSNGWYNANHVNGGHTGQKNGMISPNTIAFRQEKLSLKPNTSYTVRAWVKSESPNKQTISVHVDNREGAGQGLNQELQFEGDNWKLVETHFNTRNNPEYYSKIAIGNKGSADLYFDDVSITEWRSSEDLVRNHIVDSWHASPTRQVGGLAFSKVPKTPVRYQLEIDGKLSPISSLYAGDSQGNRYINLAPLNNSKSPSPESNIIVYAVDERNDNLKTKVAEHKGKEILNQLRPSNVNISYNTSNRFIFQFKTGTNAPNAKYYFLNRIANIEFGANTDVSFRDIPLDQFKPKTSYSLVAFVNDMEYVVYKEIGEKIPGALNGNYQIVSALNTDSVIDLDQSSNNTVLWKNNNANNQKWKLVYSPLKKAYQIKSMANENLVLTWSHNSSNPKNVNATSNQNRDEQYWIPESTTDGYFYLKNKMNPGKFLDVNGTGSNGTNIIAENKNSTKHQKFKLQKLN
ncbi:binary toxin-like calcium binding domain-containing protein [Bacillus cereus]|uniref:binary toxin-like calcium binding domain-containing protein n=1 Tax=Bacillus cereus TaxID=1396 RepID=UPI0020D20AAF|nr:binary toxin-like calcium binding domain-containing protein [Bacillus cereus]